MGGVSSTSRDPWPPSFSRAATVAKSRPPITVVEATVAVNAPQPTSVVILEQSSGVAIASAIPLERKRKSHKEGEKSSSKRSRREGSHSRPLLGVFSPEFSVSHKTNFHMNSTERTVVEPLSKVEVTNVVHELATQMAMLSWYLREFADHRRVEHV